MVLKPLIGHVPRESLVVYEGVTDAVGTTTTLKCSSIGSGSDYPDFDGNQVIPTTGPYAGQARDINGATNGDVAGTITANKAFDGIIASGTSFIITGIRTTPAEVAALQADIGDFSAQSNLKSLLAVLGSGWNTDNKTLYAKLITDLLAHGTHGLVAQNTELAEVPKETGTKTFNATTLASIEAQAEAALEDAGQVMVITTIATLATQTSFTLTAGSADDNAYNGMVAVIEDASTAAQKAVGIISNYVGGTKTITLREDPAIFAMEATDKISIKTISPDILNILADTNELQTDWVNGGRLDLLIDAIKAKTDKIFGVTTFGTETNAVGVNFTATTWVALKTVTVTKPTKLTGIKMTITGAPTNPVYRITTGTTPGTKRFPYGASNAIDTGVLKNFTAQPAVIPNGTTYNVEIYADDTVGSVVLDELDKTEIGT